MDLCVICKIYMGYAKEAYVLGAKAFVLLFCRQPAIYGKEGFEYEDNAVRTEDF